MTVASGWTDVTLLENNTVIVGGGAFDPSGWHPAGCVAPVRRNFTVPCGREWDDRSPLPLCHRHWNEVEAATRVAERVRHENECIRRAAAAKADMAAASVYYVQRSDTLIKIGYSAKLRARLSALRSEHGPLVLLAEHKGGLDAERFWHRRFASGRVTGEWFTPSERLLGHIASVRGGRLASSVGVPFGMPIDPLRTPEALAA